MKLSNNFLTTQHYQNSSVKRLLWGVGRQEKATAQGLSSVRKSVYFPRSLLSVLYLILVGKQEKRKANVKQTQYLIHSPAVLGMALRAFAGQLSPLTTELHPPAPQSLSYFYSFLQCQGRAPGSHAGEANSLLLSCSASPS